MKVFDTTTAELWNTYKAREISSIPKHFYHLWISRYLGRIAVIHLFHFFPVYNEKSKKRKKTRAQKKFEAWFFDSVIIDTRQV